MAVYTELSRGEIAGLLNMYDLAPLSQAEGIRAGIENTNYFIGLANGEQYILTLFEKRVSAQDVPFFTGLMQHLAQNGFPAPRPIAAKDGNIIQTVKGKPAIIVTFLQGSGVTDIGSSHIGQLGTCMAELHKVAWGFNAFRHNSMSFEAWRQLLGKVETRADEISAGLAQLMQEELTFLEKAWPKGLPVGIIHADLFPDNVFFDDKARLSGVIDFYFACNDFLAYELAICLNCWCFEAGWKWNAEKAKTLIEHYHARRPLSDAEREALPVLARGAALRFLLTRTHDWLFRSEGALVTPKEPLEYLAKLRFFQKESD